MKKYFLFLKNSWIETFTYRFNFILWRFRVVLSLLVIYFLWLSIIPDEKQIFGYTKTLMLTYIVGTSFVQTIVFAARNQEIGENINSGDLSIFLTKPINYFSYWFFRDLGDKLINIFFSIFEVSLLILILKPPFFIQTNLSLLFLFSLAIILAVFLNFLMGCILGMIGFWSNEIWAPRFIFYMLFTFFAGIIFPLDILPQNVFNVLQFFPFTYLVYFPLKIYLGQLSLIQIISGYLITIAWILMLMTFLNLAWRKGLKSYSAYGR